MRRFILAIIPLAGSFAASARADEPSGPSFSEVQHRIDYFEDVAAGGFVSTDIDGDGREDMVFLVKAHDPALFVLGKAQDDVVEIKSMQSVPDDGVHVRVLSGHVDGERRIFTVATNGMVRSYGDWPLMPKIDFTVEPGVSWAEVGDVDGDSRDDLIVLAGDRLLRYDLDTGNLTGSHPAQGYISLTLAQLDSDPAMELILGGGLGRVLDGATFATDWDYIDSFGDRPTAGRFGPNGESRWFGGRYGSGIYTLFGSQPWSPLWSGNVSDRILAATAIDRNGSGRDDLLLSLPHDFKVIDTQSQQTIATIRTSGDVARTGVSDTHGMGQDQIVFSSQRTPDAPQLTLVDPRSEQAMWRFIAPNGPYKAVALGDLDGDGRIEIAAAGINGSSRSTRSVIDVTTGREQWRSAVTYNPEDPDYVAAQYMSLLPRASGRGSDIIVAGESSISARMILVDGVTKQARRIVGDDQNFGAPLYGRRIMSVATLDYDRDGTLDFALGTQPNSTSAARAKILVYSGRDGSLLWESPELGNNFPEVRGIFVAEPSEGNVELVLALEDGLRAFGVPDGMLSWTLSASSDGAALAFGDTGSQEIITFSAQGQVSVFDYATRAPLRALTLPEPLRAVMPLDGDATRLLVAAQGRLLLLNGMDGTILASTARFDSMLEPMKSLSTLRISTSSWLVAAPGDSVLAWFRLDLTDRLFVGDFD